MAQILAIGFGGFLGTIARFGLSSLVQRVSGSSFPWGTLVVNVAGCLAIGVVAYFAEDRESVGPAARLFVTAGVMGGFTTFSAFGVETVSLIREQSYWSATLNVGASLVLGLGAVWAGRSLMKLLAG